MSEGKRTVLSSQSRFRRAMTARGHATHLKVHSFERQQLFPRELLQITDDILNVAVAVLICDEEVVEKRRLCDGLVCGSGDSCKRAF
jgi:hypothetical protein